MNSLPRLLLLTTVTLTFSSCSIAVEPDPPADPVPDIEADVQAIRNLQEQLTLAYNTGDAELLASLHSTDVVRMPPGAPDVVGSEAVLEGSRQSFSLADVELSNASDEILVSGDLAFARGVATSTSLPKDGSEGASSSTRYLHIYQRQADGGWLISRVIFNAFQSDE